MTQVSEITTFHLLPELWEGGLERGVIEQAIWLRARGLNPVVISAGGRWVGRLRDHDVTHIPMELNRRNPYKVLSCVSRLRKLIRHHDPKILSAHSRIPALVAHMATSKKTKGLHSPPLITNAQGYYEKHMVSRVIGRGDIVVAVSGAIRDHLSGKLGTDASRIRVIPRGTIGVDNSSVTDDECDALREKWRVYNNAPVVACVGRLSASKGWEDVIEASKYIPDPLPFFVFVGEAHPGRTRYRDHIVKLIAESGHEGNFIFAGHIDKMSAVYEIADVVAVPSRIPEPFGRVIMESIMSLTPFVTSDGSGISEFLNGDFREFTIPVKSPLLLAKHIVRMIEYADAYESLLGKLRSEILEKMTIDDEMSMTLDVYRELRPGVNWPSV